MMVGLEAFGIEMSEQRRDFPGGGGMLVELPAKTTYKIRTPRNLGGTHSGIVLGYAHVSSVPAETRVICNHVPRQSMVPERE